MQGNISFHIQFLYPFHILFSACRDVINFVSNIWHGEGSKAEGWPAKIRVIAPKYVKYVEGKNSFDSNYTVQSVKTDKVSF